MREEQTRELSSSDDHDESFIIEVSYFPIEGPVTSILLFLWNDNISFDF